MATRAICLHLVVSTYSAITLADCIQWYEAADGRICAGNLAGRPPKTYIWQCYFAVKYCSFRNYPVFSLYRTFFPLNFPQLLSANLSRQINFCFTSMPIVFRNTPVIGREFGRPIPQVTVFGKFISRPKTVPFRSPKPFFSIVRASTLLYMPLHMPVTSDKANKRRFLRYLQQYPS